MKNYFNLKFTMHHRDSLQQERLSIGELRAKIVAVVDLKALLK